MARPDLKKLSTKEIARAHLQQQVKAFLDKGGKVQDIPRGESGWDSRKGMLKPSREIFNEPKQERTPLHHLLKVIDARRAKKREKPRKRSRLPEPRKKAIYDDFGEPIRYIWVDD